ncbi:MAG TPA: entericidin A/B family lipoprotein [Burkholderiales bacterium]|nr:entericidin A/B family lipoprotein [Burkholderiales bacterium]
MTKLVVAILTICAVVLAGCNTMQGLGKDMEQAGEAIQKKANK